MEIVKATGERVSFSKDKLCDSIRKAGAPENVTAEVCAAVEKKLKPGMSTSQIFRTALRPLIREDLDVAARYSLRRGVADLGPAGFLFEQYVETILRAYGYTTRRNQIMQGKCVDHEIDVWAEKDDHHYLVEAKYRNKSGIKTHLDVVMYAAARLADIAAQQNATEDNDFAHAMWVVTNTKFTSKAIAYAECQGVTLTGWNYPRGANSLEQMILQKKLYPITVLPAMTHEIRAIFAKHDMMLAQDIVPYSVEDLVSQFGIPQKKAKTIISQVHELIA